MASDTQPRQIVFVAGTTTSVDEYPVDVDHIKQIGFYSSDDFIQFKDLFLELINSLHLNDQGIYELYPGQEIKQIRITYQKDGGNFQKVSLRTTDGLPGDPGIPEKRERLFFCDFVYISLGIAKILRKNYPKSTETLKDYTDSFDIEKQIKEWGAAGEKQYLSQRALQWETPAIKELLTEIFTAFQDITVELKKEPVQEPPAEESGERRATEADALLVLPEVLTAGVTPTVDGGGDTADTTSTPTSTRTESIEDESSYVTARQFVLGFARTTLIDDVLRRSGLDPDSLPPELRGRYDELFRILETELTIVLRNLSDEERERLASGDVSQKISVYYLLLRQLSGSPSARFYELFVEFYETEVTHLVENQQTEAAQQLVTAVTAQFSEVAQEIPELQRIHDNLLAWEREILSAAPVAATTAETDDEIETPATIVEATDEVEIQISRLPDPPVIIPTFQAQVSALPQVQQLTQNEQASIPNRSGHVIWGAMAELFSEEDLRRNNIPPELFNAVSQTAYEYLNGLSAQELKKLAKSPSSLIRHIKNVSVRLQTDAVFSETYGQYKLSYATPAINRTERIEVETQWASENLKYELFSAHDITTSLLNQSAKLTSEYRDVEQNLEAKVYGIFLTFSTDYLQLLYFNPNERRTLIIRIQNTLNADPQFLRELSEFYNELIVYFAEQQRLEEREDLVESLKSTNHSFLQEEGTFRYIVSDVQLSDSHKLFIEQLKKSLNTDSPPILQNTANVLDALIIAHGIEETNRLIQGVSPQLLEMTFGLPTGIITDDNHRSIREILGNYITVRVFNLAPGEIADHRALLVPGQTTIPTNATSLQKHLGPVHNLAKIITEDGSEKTTLALQGGVKKRIDALEKVLGQKWRNLGLEERAAVYLYFDKPFDASLKQRLKSKSADLEADKHILGVFIEFAGFNDRLLPELVTDARLNGFQRLTGGIPVETKSGDDITEFYKITRQAEILELEVSLLVLDELSALEREQLAAQYQMSAAQLEAAYLTAITTNQGMHSLPGPDEITQVGGDQQPAQPGQNLPESTTRSPLRERLKNGLRKKATGEITKRLGAATAEKALFGLGGKLAGLASGVGAAIAAAALIKDVLTELWNNEGLRNLLAGALTVGSAILLNILGNVAGLLTFAAISFVGGFSIPALLAGLAAGQAAAMAAPWARWFSQPRTPPNPFGFSTGSEQSASGTPSLAQMRGKAPGATPQSSISPTPESTTATANSGVTPDGSNASVSATTQYSTTSTTAATASGLSQLAAIPIAILAPTMGIFTVFISTILVVTVIAGAFLVPVPTKPNSRKVIDGLGQQSSSKYVTITKTPSIGATKGEIQNRTDVPVTYTITVEPKPGYSIKVTGVKDEFSGIGGQTTDLQSKLDFSKFPSEPIKDSSFSTSYTVNTGTNLIDALIMNAVTATFDVYDYTGYVIETGETYTATATIYIGNPKVGCWPTSGGVWQLPGGSFSHSRLDAYDIGNEIGTPVYAPFPGEVCDKGYDTAASGGYGLHASLKFNLGGGDLVLFFGHFVKSPKDLIEGLDARGCKTVNAGTLIGLMDDTGFSTASHLHYELRPNTIGVKLKDLHPDGQQVINSFNSGKRPVIVRDCFGGTK
jgi:murein DD-endopeptidase MepM/ murein hydrolase activator NlpD